MELQLSEASSTQVKEFQGKLAGTILPIIRNHCMKRVTLPFMTLARILKIELNGGFIIEAISCAMQMREMYCFSQGSKGRKMFTGLCFRQILAGYGQLKHFLN